MGEKTGKLCGHGLSLGEHFFLREGGSKLSHSTLQYFLWDARIGEMSIEELISRMSTYYGPLLDSFGPNLIVGAAGLI